MHRVRQPQHDFFRHFLNRSSQIHFPLTELRLGLAGGAAEHVVKLAACHGQAGAIIKILHVHSEGTVRLEIYQVFVYGLDVLGLSVGREPHHLILP